MHPASSSLRALRHSSWTDSAWGMSLLEIRLITLLLVLVGALLGVLPPILGSWLRADDGGTARAVRAFGSGVVLALALVHMLPEGFEQLSELQVGFPIGGLPVLGGLLALIVADYVAAYLLRVGGNGRKARREAEAEAPAGTVEASGGRGATGDLALALPPAAAPPPPAAVRAPCAAAAAAAALRGRHVACGSMEVGCVFHSVVIGVSLGVADSAALLPLAAAMAAHQALEGLALGALLVRARLPLARRLAMALCFAASMPVGVAAGAALAARARDMGSRAALAAQGALNGASGGMLLYVALGLVGEELAQPDLLSRPQLACGLAAALLAGAGCMCAIGVVG